MWSGHGWRADLVRFGGGGGMSDFEWLSAHLPEDGSVRIRSLTNDYTILLLAGPRARQVLQATTRLDCSAKAFGWLEVRTGFVGIAPAVIMAVSYSGEQAFEIHLPNSQLHAAYLALRGPAPDTGCGCSGRWRWNRCGWKRAIFTGRRI